MQLRRGIHIIFLVGLLTLLAYFKLHSGIKGPRIILPVVHIRRPVHAESQGNGTISSEKVKVVIILAYMHTGSTFIGSILQQSPGMYYEYERLRSIQSDTGKGLPIVYMNGSVRDPKLQGLTLATDAVSKMITCRHDELDISTLSRYFHAIQSKRNRDTADYYKCVNADQWHDRPRAVLLSGRIHLMKDLRRNSLNSHTPHYKNNSRNQNFIPKQNATFPNLSEMPWLKPEPFIQRCLPLMTGRCKNATARSVVHSYEDGGRRKTAKTASWN